MRYSIVIHKDETSSYGVTVPDLPGCFSGGETLEGAYSAAEEAIVGHIETLLMEGLPIPEATPLHVHQADEDFIDGIWGLVEVDLPQPIARGSELGTQGLSR